MRIGAGRLFTGTEELRDAWVEVDDGRISAIGSGIDGCDLRAAILTPGFVDVHSHGGGGYEFADAAHVEDVLAMHRANGTTTMVASLVTATLPDVEAQVRALSPLVADGTLAGIHLEGPWLGAAYKGAHPIELLRDPEPGEVAAILDAGKLDNGRWAVRMVTLAVELPGALEAIAEIVGRDAIVAIGHGDMTYEHAAAAFDAGASGVTHLFNAMPGLKHRGPGPVLASLQDERIWLELICDGVHVDLRLIRFVFDVAADRVVLVTDAMAAAGVGDGDYQLGAHFVEVRDGVARVAGEGSIAGSTLTLLRAIQTAVRCGVPMSDVVRAATSNAARYMRLADVGELVVGAKADIVCLDEDLQIQHVIAGGELI